MIQTKFPENTSEINFKYQETKAELEILKNQYQALAEAYAKIEEENVSKQSQIESLKLAIHHNTSYQINKESDYKNRVSDLQALVNQLHKEKDKIKSKLQKSINLKDNFIEKLLTTLLNLHQKIEYYKDDLTGLKKDYETQKKTLESETKLREETEFWYLQSLSELENFKNSLNQIKQEYTETKKTSENIAKNLESDFKHEHEEEISKLVKNYEVAIKTLKDNYNFKLSSQEKTHKELMNSMTIFMQTKIETIKSHYETRISNMIKDYSFQEAKFQSKTSNLSYLLDNLQNKYNSIEAELIGKSSSMSIINEERKELLKQKQELDQYIEKLYIDHKVILANSYSELEQTKQSLERTQIELKAEYENKIKIISNRKSITVEGIRQRYQKKLEKLVEDSQEDTLKLKKFHESQCEILLQELGKQEKEKTELSIKLETGLRELKSEAEHKYMAYEKMLKNSRHDIIIKYEAEKSKLEKEFKIQLYEQSRNLNLEKNNALSQLENNYKEIIKNTKAEFDKEKFEYLDDNLKKMAALQELCTKKISFVETQMEILKTAHTKELDDMNTYIYKIENELNKLNTEIKQKDVQIAKLNTEIDQLTQKIESLTKEYQENLLLKASYFATKEVEIQKKFDNDKKNALSKVYSEKLEIENKMEKTVHNLNEKYEALTLKYKILESKKKDLYLKDNQQTLQRLMYELADRNKTIESLNKDIAKLKTQVKYVDSTMKIFTTELNSFHKKAPSDAGTSVYKQRPSSVGMNNTFKF